MKLQKHQKLVDRSIRKYIPELYELHDRYDCQVPLTKDIQLRTKINEIAYAKTRELIKAIDKKDFVIEQQISIDEKQPIFVFWYQNKTKRIVDRCISSIYKHANGHKVIFITKDNLEQYITIADSIKKALEEERMTLTTFSDYVRLCLLSKYGGLWLDSTVYTTNDITDDFFSQTFLIPTGINHTNIYANTNSHAAARQKLSTFKYAPIVYIFSANKSKTVAYAKYLFEEYFKHYETIVDYWLINDILDYVIDTDDECYSEFMSCQPNSYNCECCMISSTSINKCVNIMKTSSTIFFKMTYKFIESHLLKILDAFENQC